MLSVHHIAKRFDERQVIENVSLSVRRGEVVGLLGPNGAGKTTLFHVLTGVLTPDRGQVVLDEVDVTRMPLYERARRGISYLPQEPSIFRGLTVEQNIRIVLETQVPDAERRRQRLEDLLRELGLVHIRKSLGARLSGGERRRCEIARSLAAGPSFLLLDEPFAGVDPIAVKDIYTLLRYLVTRGIGVIITDHNVRETLNIIDHAYIIESGVVLMHGTAEDVVASRDVRRVYLGRDFRM